MMEKATVRLPVWKVLLKEVFGTTLKQENFKKKKELPEIMEG
jgi:hypothetical protein